MKTTALILASLVALCANAQEHTEVHPTTPTNQNLDVVLGDTLHKTTANVYNTLVNNAPAAPNNQDLPKFSIIGKENKFYLSVGAQFKSTINYDWGNPIQSPSSFTPSVITAASKGNKSNLDFTVQRSRLSFNFIGLPDTDNQLGVYIAMIFNNGGNEYGVKINHAYAKYHGFTIGYTSTLFSDQTAIPYTIDAQSPNSTANFSNTVVNYEHRFQNNMKIGVGLEKNVNSITTNNYTNKVSQRLPDMPLYIQYRWNKNSHIRLSSVIRNISYRNIETNSNNNIFGWGAKLSGILEFDHFTLYYMGTCGKGVASYIEDNLGQNIDLTPSANKNGTMQATKSWGAYGALQYNFSKRLFSTLIYSHVRNSMDSYKSGNISFGDQYKYGQYAVANIIWSPNKYIQTGLEYLWGNRNNFDNTSHHNNRIMAMFSVSL
ncbi:MAG: DcaP family trimeric outer membrane transporter [Muribaculaceae bacterium]|jgi:hypothetical protein|nr:hypothetical protein [Muribaculaceae bacterium]MEE1338821.1 DcaP family trimeric outer membrane transporter [Muribaculaceae bacterium]